ncbi:MAG TPA: hypothetical protein VER03_09045 [Bryobacteraceae bacterium]|nr:hypothetical protein [Bryobacteraceae bacterium]
MGSSKPWLLAIWISAHGISAQQADLLASVKLKLHDDLRRLPNYLCTETIDQSRIRGYSCSGPECHKVFLSRIRLDVGFVKGKQIFGWPGGERLSDSDVSRFVSGLVTDGDLVALARILLVSKPTIKTERYEDLYGRAAIRYDFHVPLDNSGWLVGTPAEQLNVAYSGSFWVDPSSQEVVELRILAEGLPSAWEVKAIDRTLQYTRIPIGSRSFLLPSRALLVTTLGDGMTRIMTEAQFSNCRQYTAESTLEFPIDAVLSAQAPANASRHPTISLPDEFAAELSLETEIDTDRAAVGDLITARLKRKLGKRWRVRKNSDIVLHGRIDRLNVVNGRHYVGIAFNYLEIGGEKVDIRNRRNELIANSEFWRLIQGANMNGGRIYIPRGQILRFRSIAGNGA